MPTAVASRSKHSFKPAAPRFFHVQPDTRKSVLKYKVDGSKIDAILCHRKHPDPQVKSDAQYLVRWKVVNTDPEDAPVSWHDSEELRPCLPMLHDYVEWFKQNKESLRPSVSGNVNGGSASIGANGAVVGTLDGQSLDSAQVIATNGSEGGSENPRKRSLSVSSIDTDTEDPGSNSHNKRLKSALTPSSPQVYNAIIKKRDGIMLAVPNITSSEVPRTNATLLPTTQMRAESYHIDTVGAEYRIRRSYLAKLDQIPGPKVTLFNAIDRQTPSLAFRFVNDYIYHESASHAQRDDLIIGCTSCRRPQSSRHTSSSRGCENPMTCDCMTDAAPDEDAMSDAQRAEWRQVLQEQGADADGSMMPRSFPYATGPGPDAGCLIDSYLRSRRMIYECNKNCTCDARCHNRNVQHGRRIRLQIFKTANNRGFGLKTLEPLRQGQFIDTYRGEIISDAEADRREAAFDISAAHYMFALDKFSLGGSGGAGGAASTINGTSNTLDLTQDTPTGPSGVTSTNPNGPEPSHSADIRQEDTLVVDGRDCGTVMRFVNHSCDPNLQMHTVSYSKYNHLVYDLAFFAGKDIEAGAELSFDYMERGAGDEGVGPAGPGTSASLTKSMDMTTTNGSPGGPNASSSSAKTNGSIGNADGRDGSVLGTQGQQNQASAPRPMAVCRCGARNCRGFLWC